VLPIIPFAMLGSFVTSVLGIILPYVAMPFAFITQEVLHFVIFVAHYLANLPFATVKISDFVIFYLILTYLFLFLISSLRFFNKDD
jgi:hypothetical protein